MSANSKIEWTDHTFNPWIGCTKVSPGCEHCYAETLDTNRFSKTLGDGTKENPVSHWGKGAPRHRTSESNWKLPLKWNEQAKNSGTRPRVFCASLADWLDDEVDRVWRYDLLDLIQRTPNLDWLLLTKRPENFKRLLEDSMNQSSDRADEWISAWLNGTAPHNVSIGTTVEDQPRAGKRIPALEAIPAKIRFLSCEPLLGAVDLMKWLPIGKVSNLEYTPNGPGSFKKVGPSWFERQDTEFAEHIGLEHTPIHWVICGGESGDKARPMHPDWARSLRDQCQAAGVAFFFKQWGEWCAAPPEADCMDEPWCDLPYGEFHGGENFIEDSLCSEGDEPTLYRIGKKKAGRLLDGEVHNEFPSV